ncbi:hypothetical protein OG196_32025 [Kitasatospora purpeofusca]|uniref:hypothetical protein n=1 Tax=Kitasatospora purpeofusca TaxID=67352 RepID=UPI002E15C091|nr:hypothetical protein OG196_32025 [Kitasatospora purpeofusca]
MSGTTPSKQLADAATALEAALKAVEEAGLDPMPLLGALRGPLEMIDGAATRMREMRREGVVAAYPDRSHAVWQIAEASGLSPALVTRYASDAGLEKRNRRNENA